jgi:hypothetical protein
VIAAWWKERMQGRGPRRLDRTVNGLAACDSINPENNHDLKWWPGVHPTGSPAMANRTLSVENCGDALVLRPVPADPIGAALGSLAGPGPSSEELRAERAQEALADERKWGPR